MKKIIASALLMLVNASNAAQVTTDGLIDNIFVHPGYSVGEIIFKLDTNAIGCEGGYWLKSDDSASSFAQSFLISAKLSSKSVKIIGETGDLWQGSSAKYCKLKRASFSE